MKIVLYISTIGILLFGCVSQRNSMSDQILLTEEFQDADSINIVLEYRDFQSCIDDQPAKRIYMFFYKDETTVTIYDNVNSKKKMGPIQGSILPELKAFEKNARGGLGCGGYSGGHGILVRLKMNEKVGEFGYCKDIWDGVGELLKKLEIRAKN